MNVKLISEMWEMSEGGEMPKDFLKTCEAYFKHKCVFAPHDFTESDFAACVMNYKLAKSVQKMKKELLKKICGEENGGKDGNDGEDGEDHDKSQGEEPGNG